MNLYELLKSKGQPLSPPKGEVVVRQGEQDRNLYFIETGLLKANYVREDGKELIKSFLREGDIIGSLSSCVEGDPSTFTLICLESSQLMKVPFAELTRAAELNTEIAQQVMQFLLKLAMKKERREFELLCLDAEKRYELLLNHDPHLIERITQNDIAKYLGITPVALSRIRRRRCL